MATRIFTNAALVLVALLTWTACGTTKGSSSSKNDKSAIVLGTWQIKTIEKGGRTIDINAIAGETFMEFTKSEKKDKDGKKLVKYRFRMEMGGSDRVFDYKIEGDSVKFVGVKGWNDMHIIALDKEQIKLDQIVDGDMIRWNGYPRPDIDKQKKEDAKKAENQKK